MKLHAPSAERNRDEILAVLPEVFPRSGTILEIASGSGQHAVHFAPHFPALSWQPSDRDEEALASIRAWSQEAALPNLLAPIELDVCWPNWPIAEADAMVCINMVHIAPWQATLALMSGAARTLKAGAPLFLYGPYLRADRATAPSNLDFDASLRARDPAWGVRQLEDVVAAAGEAGLQLDQVVDMPNNNCCVVLRAGAER